MPGFLRINSSLESQPDFIYDETGKITGYKTKAGADTVFPFKSGNVKMSRVGSSNLVVGKDYVLVIARSTYGSSHGITGCTATKIVDMNMTIVYIITPTSPSVGVSGTCIGWWIFNANVE